MYLKFYNISLNGEYLTSQWLTDNEATAERKKGYTVNLAVSTFNVNI